MESIKYRTEKELLDTYMVVAKFYEDNKYRLYADILKKNVKDKNYNKNVKIDAYIVMINPGKCSPIKSEKIFNNDEEVEAKADQTQLCVMRLMDNCNFQRVRILNLYDIVEPNLLKAIQAMKGKEGDEYCIFSNKVKLENYIEKDAVFILAWGVNKSKVLQPFKEQANNLIKELGLQNRIIKVCFDGDSKERLQYRHLKPLKKSARIEIIKEIKKQYDNRNRITGEEEFILDNK
ncbi:MAG: DUF1643 domain-containing protein [Lachnospiraceae bacterium]|nr:DUF1643 domain-containing protein [Lachnospiraceae bacterium]